MNNHARHKFLYSLAAEIAARENINPFSDNNEANIVAPLAAEYRQAAARD